MPLVFACVVPHGEPIIPTLASAAERRRNIVTTKAMQRLAREVRAARPHLLIIATPHNLRLRGHIGVVTAENASGALPMFGKGPARLRIRVKCDVEFANKLLKDGQRRGLPIIGANYATATGRYSNMPLDWGTLVPLSFFIRGHRVSPKLVVVTPSREIPLAENLRFGTLIADVAKRSKKRVVLVASADHGHAHKKSGPYGFSPAAAKYDALMVDTIRRDALRSLLRIDMNLVRRAKPDSLWQLITLAGVAERLKLRPELYSYEVPAYYGMICAAFRTVLPISRRASVHH
jgi:aromatic ring-opening dioxygenase LigB subunit